MTQPLILTVAAVAALALAPIPSFAADDDKNQKPASVSLPAGIKSEEAENPSDVHKTFENLAEAAVTKGGFDDMVERLADQDRNRIGKFAEEEFTTLDGRIGQIRKAWKEKYGKDLDFDDDAKSFSRVGVTRGEIENLEQVANNWPLPLTSGQAGGDAVAAAAKERADDDAAKSKPGLDSNIEKGRDVAVATIPASHGLPQVNVSLIREAGGWRVDVPNTLTGQQIHDRLLAHLTHVGDNATQWPGDVKDAQLMFAHHVLMAVYGADVPKAQDRQAPPGTAGNSQNQNATDKD